MSMTIDCGTCSHRQTSSCDDCVVTFIVEREPNEAVVIDVAEFTALRRLQSAGLVPDLLHEDERSQDRDHATMAEPTTEGVIEPLAEHG